MSFLTNFIGQIEFIDIFNSAGSNWHCKYEFVSGADWKYVAGLESGVTQTATADGGQDKIVLSFPLEITYKSTNPSGWPQIILSVYKNMNLEGYGRAHLPITRGCHKIQIPLFKPVPSSLFGYLFYLFGYQPELLDPTMLASAVGNQMLQTVSSGHVEMAVNLMTQGFDDLGYDIGNK